jgi:hypothetical protein
MRTNRGQSGLVDRFFFKNVSAGSFLNFCTRVPSFSQHKTIHQRKGNMDFNIYKKNNAYIRLRYSYMQIDALVFYFSNWGLQKQ